MAAADVAVVGVPSLSVGQGERVHEVGKLAICRRPENEVPVVRHQAIREQSHPGHMDQTLDQNSLKGFKIAILVEDGGAPVPPIEYMVNIAPQRGA